MKRQESQCIFNHYYHSALFVEAFSMSICGIFKWEKEEQSSFLKSDSWRKLTSPSNVWISFLILGWLSALAFMEIIFKKCGIRIRVAYLHIHCCLSVKHPWGIYTTKSGKAAGSLFILNEPQHSRNNPCRFYFSSYCNSTHIAVHCFLTLVCYICGSGYPLKWMPLPPIVDVKHTRHEQALREIW